MEEAQKEKYRNRFVRWQKATIEERGKVVSLILSLSLATIAFVFHQIVNNVPSKCYAKCSILIGLLGLLLSTLTALFVTLNRLNGLRQTTDIASARKNGDSEESIIPMQTENKAIDKITLTWFNNMIWMFGIGEFFVIIGLVIEFWDKLL